MFRNMAVFLFLLFAVVAGAQEPTIATFAGGGPNGLAAVDSNLAYPTGVTVDSAGNQYICAQEQNRVFKRDIFGVLTVVAGSGIEGYGGDGGPAVEASLASPAGVAVDADDNVYVADSGNNVVRKVDISTGIITTVAGTGAYGFGGDGGPATDADLAFPTGVALDLSGNLYIADADNSRIRMVDAGSGNITTFAGTGGWDFSGDGGPASDAELNWPTGVAVDGSGNVYIADTANSRIRVVDAVSGVITTAAGNGDWDYYGDGGPATDAALGGPMGVVVDGVNIYIADTFNNVVREVSGGNIATVAGDGSSGFGGDGGPATDASLAEPWGLAVNGAGELYIADSLNNRVREVAGGVISTVAGNGDLFFFSGDGEDAIKASLGNPTGLAYGSGGYLYIADQMNHRIRKAGPDGLITTVAGSADSGFDGDGGPATEALLLQPGDVAVDSDGNLYIADTLNNRIRKVDTSGMITTVAGDGSFGFGGDGGLATAASFFFPTGVAVDSDGNLYIADSSNHRVRKIDAVTQIIETVAGTGDAGFNGDDQAATDAQLNTPFGVAVDASGALYIADTFNDRVRKVDALGTITTVAGNGVQGFSGDGGPAVEAALSSPAGVDVDSSGNLYIADSGNDRVREVDGDGNINTIAGNGVRGYSGDGGPATLASLAEPRAVGVDESGRLFIADSMSHRVRVVPGGGLPDPDPDPEADPEQLIEDLIGQVGGLDIKRGTKNSLTAKLENALKSLEKGNEGAAVNKLHAFINEVEAQRGKALSNELADQLVAAAQAIIDVILGV